MKNCCENTTKMYEKCLLKMLSLNIDYKIIDNIDNMTKSIENIKSNNGKNIGIGRVKTYLSAVLWFHTVKNNSDDKNSIQNLSNKILFLTNKCDDEYHKNKLSEKEKKVYLEWDDIVKVYNDLYSKRLNSFLSFKKCVSIALYVLFPPRRIADYSSMIIKKNTDNIDDDHNYYIIYPPFIYFYTDSYFFTKRL